jgi:peroxin-7
MVSPVGVTARSKFHTELTGYSVEFSPFHSNLLSVSTAQNFGIIGTGRQYILQYNPGTNIIQAVAHYDTRDGCYDCVCTASNDDAILCGAVLCCCVILYYVI